MNLRGPICRLIVDELPVDAYGMKVLAVARDLWAKQGKVCISTGRALGFRDFGATRMEVRYNSTTGEDPAGRVFPQYWRLVDMAKEGDYLLESTVWVMKYANGTLFN